MVAINAIPDVVQEKLKRFEVLRPEFFAAFPYVQQMHGRERFGALTIDHIVRYLHALWVCDSKDRLLSAPRFEGTARYDGQMCLDLLARWQAGDTAAVVAFLQYKLDGQPFAMITAQWEVAHERPELAAVAQTLADGRMVLLNRAMNLLQALDAIFSHSVTTLVREVQAACEHYGHLPEQITQQLAELQHMAYGPLRHPELARQNMQVMNMVGIHGATAQGMAVTTDDLAILDVAPVATAPFAEFRLAPYLALTSTRANNLNGRIFLDSPDAAS